MSCVSKAIPTVNIDRNGVLRVEFRNNHDGRDGRDNSYESNIDNNHDNNVHNYNSIINNDDNKGTDNDTENDVDHDLKTHGSEGDDIRHYNINTNSTYLQNNKESTISVEIKVKCNKTSRSPFIHNENSIKTRCGRFTLMQLYKRGRTNSLTCTYSPNESMSGACTNDKIDNKNENEKKNENENENDSANKNEKDKGDDRNHEGEGRCEWGTFGGKNINYILFILFNLL